MTDPCPSKLRGDHLDRPLSLAVRVTRFWMQVNMATPEDCWEWTGYAEEGYGRYFDGERMRFAHQLAVEWTTGEARPDDLDTCHSCHNPLCVNPQHLRYDTRSANVADMVKAGRWQRNTKRLTSQDARTLRERHYQGASGRQLAREYAISEQAVSAILKGRRWPTAGGPIKQPKETQCQIPM